MATKTKATKTQAPEPEAVLKARSWRTRMVLYRDASKNKIAEIEAALVAMRQEPKTPEQGVRVATAELRLKKQREHLARREDWLKRADTSLAGAIAKGATPKAPGKAVAVAAPPAPIEKKKPRKPKAKAPVVEPPAGPVETLEVPPVEPTQPAEEVAA
jgi:hypothetical protein